MNTKLLTSALIVAAGFAAGSSFAQNAPVLTRDQVTAQYIQAREQGNLAPTGEVQFQAKAPSASTSGLTREAVHSAVLQANRNGALAERGEGADIGYVASGPSTTTRAAVRAEARYAVRHGLIVGGEV